MNAQSFEVTLQYVHSQACQERLSRLYGARGQALARQTARCERLLQRFAASFGAQDGIRFFSAPGRTEIGGNHTDHNAGCVLAAAVDLDTVAAAAATSDGIIAVDSEGYSPIRVDTADLAPRKGEEGTTAAIVRGVAARMQALGYTVGGFHATVTSNVLNGSGLSSSAAFEVLMAAILDGLYNGWTLPGVLRAQIAQYAENVYFGKPCGLMDQTASSIGGLVSIDFGQAEPVVHALTYDFAARGYAVCVVNTGGDHGDLTDHYAAIRSDMERVAACLGGKVLREVTEAQVLAALPLLRERADDRAVLRAFHFFDDNRRVGEQVAALEADDLPAFLAHIIASGQSSWMLLQNVWADAARQQMALALELSRRLLTGRGAWRVHGGGFAGTILAFVPTDLLDAYVARMDGVFGAQACTVLSIRAEGAVQIMPE